MLGWRFRDISLIVAILGTGICWPAARATPAEPAAGPILEITVHDGRLSVDLRDAPLAETLRRVGERADVKVNLRGEFKASLTRAFTDVPLEEGLRRLARGYSLSLAYAPTRDGGGAPRLTEIWVVESSPTALAPVRGEPSERAARLASLRALGQRRDEAAVTELSQILAQDPDPAVRGRAATALSQMPGAPATAALAAALGDHTSSVRIQAIQGLQRVEGERAAELLAGVLLSDPDPRVRRAAAAALAALGSDAAGAALRSAASDTDESVRRAAAQALTRWEAARR